MVLSLYYGQRWSKSASKNIVCTRKQKVGLFIVLVIMIKYKILKLF